MEARKISAVILIAYRHP